MRRRLSAPFVLGALMLLVGCGTVVPNVAGMTLAQAKDTMDSVDLTVVRVMYDEQSTAAAGTVIRQIPEAGATTSQSVPMTVVVAGPAWGTVPDVSGHDEDSARAILGSVNFGPGDITEAYDPSAPVGTVISQSPAAGTESLVSVPVAVVISKGPQPAAAP